MCQNPLKKQLDEYRSFNALAETINGLYKTELVHRQGPWRKMQDLEIATLGWVDWFNNRRLLGPIGNIPPAEAEENFYAQRNVLDMVAPNEAIGLRQIRGDSGRSINDAPSMVAWQCPRPDGGRRLRPRM